MRTSHLQIRRRIMEEKSRISDEELFTSREYQAYLTDKVEAATKRFSRPIRVTVYADPQDETIAYTDYQGIFINVCNSLTQSFPTRRLRSLSIEGLQAHECGHNLFTDNKVWLTHMQKLEAGKFYPRKPTHLGQQEKEYAQKVLDALQDTKDPIPRMVVLQTARSLENILEDGFVDARYSFEFPGTPAQGIALNNLRFCETVPDVAEMVDQRFYEHSILLNLLIQYVRSGDINNRTQEQGELLDAMARFVPLVDGCIRDEDARSRCMALNRILVDLWPFMERCFEDLRERKKEEQEQGGSTQGGPSQNGEEREMEDGMETDPEEALLEALKNALESQLPRMNPNFAVKTGAVPESNGSYQPTEEEQKAVRTQMARVIAQETARIASGQTGPIISRGDGTVIYNSGYEGSGYGYALEDMERLLDNMAEHKVVSEMEEELSQALQCEANNVRYGNAHRGVDVTVNRMAHVDQRLIDSYRAITPDLLRLSKRLQRSVRRVIEDKRQGGRETGLLYGKRLHQKSLYRDDGRVFCNTRLPTEPVDISVALLVDESGSMCGNDRITRARATAIVMQDFCEALGIPLLIVGHTAFAGHVELFSYVDFDSVDRLDRYRLMDMSARDCNRDGAALRFVAEKLLKQPSEVKLLIIISDGQPNDEDYTGSSAEEDLRGIKLEYSRKGIKLYAAAIGEDKERIEHIYGNGYLDITDLNDLPMRLTNLIARSMPL